MTPYEMARDLAKYRHNTRFWMRQRRSWPVAFRTEATCQGCYRCEYGSIQPCPSQTPEWMRRGQAKVLSGPTESELRAQWGDR